MLLLPSLNQSLTITHSGEAFQGNWLSSLCLMFPMLSSELILVAAKECLLEHLESVSAAFDLVLFMWFQANLVGLFFV